MGGNPQQSSEMDKLIGTIRREDPKRARQIQQDMSHHFEEYFARGLAVIGAERSPEAGVYLFGKWE